MSAAAPEIESELRALVRKAKEAIADDVPFSEITKLDLSDCGLNETFLKDEYAALLPNLSILFLSNNQFTEMPAVIGQFPKLQMVAMKSNQLQSIHPDALQSQLRWLILTDNALQQLPDTIGRCTQLQKLMLSGNRLTSLPATLSQHCTQLELIRLATNQLIEPPLALLQKLPNLKWVALANNPFLQQHHWSQEPPVNVIAEEDLSNNENAEILGRGASGVTRKQFYQGQPVAVKTYHTTTVVTSDGLPQDERNISMAVSQLNADTTSSAFVRVLGQCRSTGALVMEYLENYASLADPPSLTSCTRDVYSGRPSWMSGHAAVHLVTVLLDALHQLHAHNMVHGDFYGHNILIQNNNNHDPIQVRVTDFGAAFFFDGKAEYAQWLGTIELRALAVLIAEVSTELLLPNDEKEDEIAVKSHLKALEQACLRDGATFDQVQVWWTQRRLREMASAFGVDSD